MADQKLTFNEAAVAVQPLRRALPPSIWSLGLSAMFMDMSSELVHSLLPVLMVSVLGASMVTIGFLEGVAEATAAITKIFSGALSDYLGKRKFLVVLGYGLGAITKPVFPLAPSISWVFGARFTDRIGKGIRGAPRDALVADITPAELRGAAYGLRQSLDSVGAFLGPLLAIAFMALWANDIKAVLWIAVLPAVISVALVLTVREPQAQHNQSAIGSPISFASAKRLQWDYWMIVVFGAVFTLARFSEAFLILRAQSVGLSIGLVPMIMIVMNLVYAASAYPAGIASDHLSRRMMLVAGLSMLVVAEVVLAVAAVPWQVFAGAGLWGLHMGFTQGLFNKLVADTAPAELRGTAFGFFNLTSGVSMLLASVIAGLLWQSVGPQATFFAGASFAALAAIGVLAYQGKPAAA
ncbi:MAG TPA: MFS transporter [Candidatus Binatia bacterium]|nr:MFS transporter [Candidatus Binatia bacterium]